MTTIESDFETALAEADPSIRLSACPRWAEFQALSPDHAEFFAGFVVAWRGCVDDSTPMRAAGAAYYAARQEAG